MQKRVWIIMPSGKLTKKQQDLLKEINEIVSLLDIGYQNILQTESSFRTTKLEIIKNQIIRGQVIMYYTLVDEHLNNCICQYYFGKRADFVTLWRTKRFKLFNHHIIEELSLIKKLAFVKAIRMVPKNISEEIERLNALRNGIAHAFFPENLKRFKPIWKGEDIFTLKGIKTMVEDMEKVFNFFLKIHA